MMSSGLVDGMFVLDIGCGGAPYADLFERFQYVGIDLAKREPRQDMWMTGDACHLPFRSDIFGLVIASEILEHISDPRTVLAEICRVLEPQGHVLLTTRFVFPYHPEPGDYFRFTQDSLFQLFNDTGFNIQDLENEGGILSLLANIVSWYGQASPRPMAEIADLFAKSLDILDKRINGLGSEWSPGFHVHATKSFSTGHMKKLLQVARHYRQ